jgi:hypothetical protein
VECGNIAFKRSRFRKCYSILAERKIDA